MKLSFVLHEWRDELIEKFENKELGAKAWDGRSMHRLIKRVSILLKKHIFPSGDKVIFEDIVKERGQSDFITGVSYKLR